jgi:hypothetical protein
MQNNLNKTEETTEEVLQAAPETVIEETAAPAQAIVEGDEILDGTEEHLEVEGNTATELPVMAEPTTEPSVQASSPEHQTEIKEPAENNG